MVDIATHITSPLDRRGQRHISRTQIATISIFGVTFLWCLQRAFTYASLWLSTRFAPYDDEGYVLLSVREFLAGGGLYDKVYTNYGPTYYAYKQLLWIIQGVPTHDLTRVTTLYTWMCAAVLLGLAGLWLTRSGLVAIAVFCASTLDLTALGNEPGHPQELLVALTALSVAVAASPLRLRLRVVLLASISTLACFTKMNVGAFVLLATLATVLPLAPGAPRIIAALLFGSVPAVLMFRNIKQWAWSYALACGAAIVAAVVMRPNTELRVKSFRTGAPILAGLLLPAALLIIYLVSTGTTLAGVLDGVLLRPLQFGSFYVSPLQLSLSSVAASLVAAGIAVYAAHYASTEAWPLPLQYALTLFKIAVGLSVALGVWDPVEIIGKSGIIVLALLLPSGSRGSSEYFGRAFLALSAAFHTAAAYPVAGSQIAWSSFLLITASYVCLWDGLTDLRVSVADVPAFGRAAATGFLCLGLAVDYASLTPVAALEARFQDQVPLPLEGATSIRLPHSQVAVYTWVTQNLKGHCSDFVTLPGYGSLYLWSGMRPPTGYNVTAWTFLLNDREQRKTVNRMRSAARPCAVNNANGLKAWTNEPVAGLPLADYIMRLTPVVSYAGYEFRIPQGLVPTWKFDYLLSGSHTFGGAELYPVPAEAVAASSLRLWFKGEGRGGTIVGVQSTTSPHVPPGGWCPIIYLGRDGRLRAEFWNGRTSPITTVESIDDHRWHHVVVVKRPDSQRLFVDGKLVGETGAATAENWAVMQLGTGFTATWPSANDSWFPFRGEIRDVVVAREPWGTEDVVRDFTETRR